MTVQTNEQVITETTEDLVEPNKYTVILHNDDKTTFDFVIYILELVYNKTGQDAVDITRYIHNNGAAAVGMYTFQIAETKVDETHTLAKINKFPLKATLQEV
jgi:ATP-dependent Clp protease adaptor protein ClpS